MAQTLVGAIHFLFSIPIRGALCCTQLTQQWVLALCSENKAARVWHWLFTLHPPTHHLALRLSMSRTIPLLTRCLCLHSYVMGWPLPTNQAHSVSLIFTYSMYCILSIHCKYCHQQKYLSPLHVISYHCWMCCICVSVGHTDGYREV
jgi:hypothetical protein